MSAQPMSAQPSPRRPKCPTALLMAAAALVSFPVAPTLAAETAKESPAALTEAQWQPRKLHFEYMGFTSRYTCDGMESKVRQILTTFGARKDMTVRAYGCPGGFDRPSKMISVDAEFSALASLSGAGGAASATPAPTPAQPVKVEWVKVRLAPRRPDYMGDGECELVEQMHDLLQKGFLLRNVEYHTSCIPHQITLGDYAVSADVMKPAAK